MEYGTIEREIYIEASPETVFEVVSSPDHLKEWWPDDAQYEPTPGSAGEIVFVLEQQYQEHVTGWDFYLPRLAPYVATLQLRP